MSDLETKLPLAITDLLFSSKISESLNDHEPKHTPTNRPSGRKTNDPPRKLDGLQAREEMEVDGQDRRRTR